MCGTCVPENGSPPPTPLLLLWSANMQGPSARKKGGKPHLFAAECVCVGGRGGGGSTVAHKRIRRPHKDSGPLLSPTGSTKEMTFVCLAGREGGCVRTVQLRRRRWRWGPPEGLQ